METALRNKGTEQSWQIFKDDFHQAQDVVIPRCKKLSKEGKRMAWLSWDLLVKLIGKKETRRRWKQGRVFLEEYRDTAWLCRDAVRKATAQLELNLARMQRIIKRAFTNVSTRNKQTNKKIRKSLMVKYEWLTRSLGQIMNIYFFFLHLKTSEYLFRTSLNLYQKILVSCRSWLQYYPIKKGEYAFPKWEFSNLIFTMQACWKLWKSST